jgi:hypothetical protein
MAVLVRYEFRLVTTQCLTGSKQSTTAPYLEFSAFGNALLFE